MTLQEIAERLNAAMDLIDDTYVIGVQSGCNDPLAIQLRESDFRRLFAGRECEVSEGDGCLHYSVSFNGCTFRTVENKPQESRTLVLTERAA